MGAGGAPGEAGEVDLSPEALPEGSKVKYWSQTVQRWITATVKRHNADGTIDLDLKRKAQKSFIRIVAPKQPAAEAAATAEVTAKKEKKEKKDKHKKHKKSTKQDEDDEDEAEAEDERSKKK